jgi:Tfp pilus assembly protein PilN
LLLLAVVGLLLLIFQLSLNISRNEERIKVLTQELGLLRHTVATLQRAAARPGDKQQPAPEEPNGEPGHD